MGRILSGDVLKATGQTQMYDIINAIRNSSSSFFKEMVPLANAENVAEVGQAINLHPQTQNEFVTALVNRIGLVIIRQVTLKNPLSQFKSGTMELGRSIEEIFVDLTFEHLYDPEVAETQVFKREKPDVKTLYHELNRQGFYKQTIQEESLKQAFTSWDKFGSFTASIIQSMYNTLEVDEYKYMKLLLANYYAKGHFKVVEIDAPVNIEQSEELVRLGRRYATLMTMPQGSRKYNSLGVHTTTAPEDLIFLITAERAADMDVDVMAKAFNLDRTSFLGQQIIMDDLNFGKTNEVIEMIILDKKFFMVFDHELKMTSAYNAQGLYWNYFLHIWQTISASRFANAVIFVRNPQNKITEVVVNPAISEIKKGIPTTFEANVSIVEGQTVTYETTFVAQTEDGETATGVTVTSSGNTATVTVSEDFTGERFILRARATYGTAPLEFNVDGRAMVYVK